MVFPKTKKVKKLLQTRHQRTDSPKKLGRRTSNFCLNSLFMTDYENYSYLTIIPRGRMGYQRFLDPTLPRTSNRWRSRDKSFASRFQRGEVGFHVCHLPESFQRIILVLSHVMIQKSCGASLHPLTEAQIRAKWLNLINLIGS